jgi:hypothetical protein
MLQDTSIKDIKMDSQILYQEKLFSKWMTLILSVATLAMLITLLCPIFCATTCLENIFDWFLMSFFLLFLALTFTFSYLKITITTQDITVSYGIFRYIVAWDKIQDCQLDNSKSFYGGWGIRMGKRNGKWILVYNTIGGARVILSLKDDKYGEFIFSTEHPEQILPIIRNQLNIKTK